MNSNPMDRVDSARVPADWMQVRSWDRSWDEVSWSVYLFEIRLGRRTYAPQDEWRQAYRARVPNGHMQIGVFE
jgi:hypothetical protein